MNLFQLIRAAADSHRKMLAQAEELLDLDSDCDHDVGVCRCGLRRDIMDAQFVQAELDRRFPPTPKEAPVTASDRVAVVKPIEPKL